MRGEGDDRSRLFYEMFFLLLFCWLENFMHVYNVLLIKSARRPPSSSPSPISSPLFSPIFTGSVLLKPSVC